MLIRYEHTIKIEVIRVPITTGTVVFLFFPSHSTSAMSLWISKVTPTMRISRKNRIISVDTLSWLI